MKHFMCDLETMGTTAGCAIVSIGVIGFDPNAATVDGIFEEGDLGFYTVVSRDSCLDNFLHEDTKTRVDFWEKKADANARKALADYDNNRGLPLLEALEQMQGYVEENATIRPKDIMFYGNGADFDNPILGVAARMVDHEFPWKWGNRCYRTLKNLHEIFGEQFRAPKLSRQGTYHNALDDAKSQAMHLWETVRCIRNSLNI